MIWRKTKGGEQRADGPGSRRSRLILAVLGLLLLLSVMGSLLTGRLEISLRQCVGILASRFLEITPFWTQVQENMLCLVRLPRILTALLVGMALSIAGTSYQCIFRNPMAAPDILGASTGAAFGAALAILLGRSSVEITLWAFVSSLGCVGLVLLCSRLCRGDAVLNLILAGIMIGSLFSAATSYLKLIADPNDTLPAITYWMMGSLSGVGTAELQWLWLPVLLAAVPVFALRWKMNLLTLDDEEAKSLGVNTGRTRMIVILCATLLTAASVAVSGIIGWVGLVIPHIARKMVGSDCRVLLPAAALLGAVFLILVDDLARSLYTTELPLGILTAFLGVPFFLYLMISGRE